MDFGRRTRMEAALWMTTLFFTAVVAQPVMEAGGNAISVWFGLSAPAGPDGPWYVVHLIWALEITDRHAGGR